MSVDPEELVSIVIPVYNGTNFVAEAIDSAVAQTYKNIEIIVVNDGSSDSGATRTTVMAYGDRVRYIEKTNGGVATALNCGIQAMRGKYFSWLSHDDKYYPWKIEKQLEYIRSLENKKSIIFSHEDAIDETGMIIRKSEPFKIDEELLYFELLHHHFIGGCSLLIPACAFMDAGMFNPAYRTVQDYDLWFRMINAGYKLCYFPLTTGMSRSHPGQDSRKLSKICRNEQQQFYVELQEKFDTKYWIDRCKNKVDSYLLLARKFHQQKLDKVSRYDLGKALVLAKNYSIQRKIVLGYTYLCQIIRDDFHAAIAFLYHVLRKIYRSVFPKKDIKQPVEHI